MSIYIPGSGARYRIPTYAGMPTGGDLFTLYYRIYLASSGGGGAFARHLTRREGTGNTWGAQFGVANVMRFTMGYSGTAATYERSSAITALDRWYDVIWTLDSSAAGTVPSLWLNAVPQSLTLVVGPSAGTANTTSADVYVGGRAAGANGASAPVSAIAWWRRILTPRDLQLLDDYGPIALPRARTGFFDFEKVGSNTNFCRNEDAPYHAVMDSGSGHRTYAPAPRKRRLPFARMPYRRTPVAPPPAAGGTLYTAALASSITAAGALTKQVRRALTGSITPASALTAVRLKVLAFASAITPAGALLKQTARGWTATITPAGTLAKQLLRSFTSAITPAGALATLKTRLLTFASSITLAGALTKTTAKPQTSSLTPAGTILRTLARTLTGTATPAGALTRQTGKALTGTITPVGTLRRLVGKAWTGVLTVAGTLVTALNGVIAIAATYRARWVSGGTGTATERSGEAGRATWRDDDQRE